MSKLTSGLVNITVDQSAAVIFGGEHRAYFYSTYERSGNIMLLRQFLLSLMMKMVFSQAHRAGGVLICLNSHEAFGQPYQTIPNCSGCIGWASNVGTSSFLGMTLSGPRLENSSYSVGSFSLFQRQIKPQKHICRSCPNSL
jgi:hypothetical protein